MDQPDKTLKGTRRDAEPPASASPRPGPRVDSFPNDAAVDEKRLKKITRLKQAVANGTYHVSAEELALKLIDHMLEPKE